MIRAVVLVVLVCARLAAATTYWVNAGGTTASNCGNSAANGCTTWFQLMSGSSTCGAGGCAGTITSGDTINWVSGTYVGNGNASGVGLPFDGTNGSPVVVQCTDANGVYAPGTCTIQGVSGTAAFCGTVVIGSNTSTTSCSSNVSTYTHLRGFVIERNNTASNNIFALVLQVSSNHIVVEDCTFDGKGKDATFVGDTSFLTWRKNSYTGCVPTNGVGCAAFGYPGGISNSAILGNHFNMQSGSGNVDCATLFSPVTVLFDGNDCTGLTTDGFDTGMNAPTSPQPYRLISRYNVMKAESLGGTSRSFPISGECTASNCATTTRTKAVAIYKNVQLPPAGGGEPPGGIVTYGGAEAIDVWNNTIFAGNTNGNGKLFWNDCQFGGYFARDNGTRYNIFDGGFTGTSDAIIPAQHAGNCVEACPATHPCPWIGNQVYLPGVTGNVAAFWPTSGATNQFTNAQIGSTFNSCTDCTANGNTGNVSSNPSFANRSDPTQLANLELTSGSNAIDTAAPFCTTTSSSSGTSVAVTCAGTENDPRHWFPQPGDYYSVANADCVDIGARAADYAGAVNAGCFEVQVGTGCRAQVSSETATTITLGSSCATWANGAAVHVPFAGTAPDRGALEYPASLSGTCSCTGRPAACLSLPGATAPTDLACPAERAALLSQLPHDYTARQMHKIRRRLEALPQSVRPPLIVGTVPDSYLQQTGGLLVSDCSGGHGMSAYFAKLATHLKNEFRYTFDSRGIFQENVHGPLRPDADWVHFTTASSKLVGARARAVLQGMNTCASPTTGLAQRYCLNPSGTFSSTACTTTCTTGSCFPRPCVNELDCPDPGDVCNLEVTPGQAAAAVPVYAADQFTRANAIPLSSATAPYAITWTQVGANLDSGATNAELNTNGVVGSGSFQHHAVMAQWGTRATAQYACARVPKLINTEKAGVCVGMTNGGTTANDGFCCFYLHTGSQQQQGRRVIVDDVATDTLGSVDNHAYPFFVGAERVDATTFRCWVSNDGVVWAQSPTSDFTVASINTPGDVGLYLNGDHFNSIPLVDDWQGGDGNPFTNGWSNSYALPCGENTGSAPDDWTSSMVAAWKLDETTGTRANSAGATSCGGTGTNCDLTCTGVTPGTDSPLQGVAAATFDGTGACSCAGATCTALTSGLSGTFTIGGWSRPEIDTGTPQLWTNYDATNGLYAERLVATSDQFKATAKPSSGTVTGTAGAARFGAWHHVVTSYNETGTVLGLIVDGGTPVTSSSNYDPPGTSQTFAVGGGSGNRWVGDLDEVFVDNATWTQAQACRVCSIGLDGGLGWCLQNSYRHCTSDADCGGRKTACDTVAGLCTGRNRTRCGSCTLPACDASAP